MHSLYVRPALAGALAVLVSIGDGAAIAQQTPPPVDPGSEPATGPSSEPGAETAPLAAPAPEPAQPDAPAPAPAQPPGAPEPAQPDAPAPAPPPDAASKRDEGKRKPEPRDGIEVRGRVFVRDTVTIQGSTHVLAVDSARLGARYDDDDRGLRAEVEVELARRNPEVRDAYVRIEPARWLRVQAGNFKRPISAVALASKTDLPVLERGLASDLQVGNEFTGEPDEFPLGGRAEGVAVTARARREHDLFGDPSVTVGVFRSPVNAQIAESSIDATPLSLADGFAEDVIARVELEPARGVVAAVSAGSIAVLGTGGDRATLRRGVVYGADVVAELGPLRLWAEAYSGDSPFHLGTAVAASGRFLAVRAIAAYRLRLDLGRLRYVEPNAAAQVVDLSAAADDDGARQLLGGVNFGFGKLWRLQLAVEYTRVDARLVGDRTAFAAQLAMVFR